MRYMITTGQIAFFKKFGFIEFENLLSVQDANKLSTQRGHDLWRKDPKIATTKLYTQIAAELLGTSIRLLTDQILTSTFPIPTKIQDIGSYQGDGIALLLKLTDGAPAEYHKEMREPYPLYPFTQGSGTFLATDKTFRFDHLFDTPQSYLLIVYGALNTQYIPNVNDPTSLSLKKMGYAFGDVLKEQTHPTVYQL